MLLLFFVLALLFVLLAYFYADIVLQIPFGYRSAQWTKLKAYLEETSKTSSSWRRNKIMCVGEEGVGKSTLLQCFIRRKAKVPCKENISTDGIEVTQGITLGEDCDVVFDAWDFGGQEVLHSRRGCVVLRRTPLVLYGL